MPNLTKGSSARPRRCTPTNATESPATNRCTSSTHAGAGPAHQARRELQAADHGDRRRGPTRRSRPRAPCTTRSATATASTELTEAIAQLPFVTVLTTVALVVPGVAAVAPDDTVPAGLTADTVCVDGVERCARPMAPATAKNDETLRPGEKDARRRGRVPATGSRRRAGRRHPASRRLTTSSVPGPTPPGVPAIARMRSA